MRSVEQFENEIYAALAKPDIPQVITALDKLVRIDPKRAALIIDDLYRENYGLRNMTDIPARIGLRSNISFDEVWERVEMHEGKIFTTSSGIEFKYKFTSHALKLIMPGASYSVSKRNLEKAFNLCPLPNAAAVKGLISGGIMYSILSDPRIRESDW